MDIQWSTIRFGVVRDKLQIYDQQLEHHYFKLATQVVNICRQQRGWGWSHTHFQGAPKVQ